MRDLLLVVFAVGIGGTLTAVYTIPAAKIQVDSLERQLGEERARRVHAQTATDAAGVRLADADETIRKQMRENDALRRQLLRERQLGAGPTEFAEGDALNPDDFIRPAGVWVPTTGRR